MKGLAVWVAALPGAVQTSRAAFAGEGAPRAPEMNTVLRCAPLRRLGGQRLFYVGEWRKGATAEPGFFDEVGAPPLPLSRRALPPPAVRRPWHPCAPRRVAPAIAVRC